MEIKDIQNMIYKHMLTYKIYISEIIELYSVWCELSTI